MIILLFLFYSVISGGILEVMPYLHSFWRFVIESLMKDLCCSPTCLASISLYVFFIFRVRRYCADLAQLILPTFVSNWDWHIISVMQEIIENIESPFPTVTPSGGDYIYLLFESPAFFDCGDRSPPRGRIVLPYECLRRPSRAYLTGTSFSSSYRNSLSLGVGDDLGLGFEKRCDVAILVVDRWFDGSICFASVRDRS